MFSTMRGVSLYTWSGRDHNSSSRSLSEITSVLTTLFEVVLVERVLGLLEQAAGNIPHSHWSSIVCVLMRQDINEGDDGDQLVVGVQQVLQALGDGGVFVVATSKE